MTIAGHWNRVRMGTLVACLLGCGVWISAQEKPPAVTPIAGIENLRVVTPELLSGSQPEGEAAFQELARRGVKVIISVDGAAPDVELAHKFGLRYVHIPISYDQIKPQSRADLVEATKPANGLVFMHCHHGQHRGPTAAGYCGMAHGKITSAEAQALLKVVGTKAEYTGLWDAIREFKPPQVPAGPLVETAEVEPLTTAMVRVDHSWAELDRKLKAGPVDDWKTLASESLLLAEEFQELPRTSPSKNEDFNRLMQVAIASSQELHQAVEMKDPAALKTASQKVAQNCTACHTSHRDR